MITRLFSLAGVFVLGATMSAPAQTTPASRIPENSHLLNTGSVLHKRVRDSAAILLAKQVDSVDWVETTFEEVIDWLHDLGGDDVNIVPRWTALDAVGVERESLVTLKLTNVRVNVVLDEVLAQLSEDDAMGYQAVRNRLKISSRQELNKRRYLRIYDATDILQRIRDFGQESPSIDLQSTATSSGGGGGQSVFSGGSSGGGSSQGGQQSEKELDKALEDLRTLIQTSILPSSWAVTSQRGGSSASGAGLNTISIFNRSLVVNATPEVHELIAGYFAFGG